MNSPLVLHPSYPLRSGTLIFTLLVLGMTSGCEDEEKQLTHGQWLTLQRNLQQEVSDIGRQRDQLEADRRSWDLRERRDHLLAAVINSSVLMLCCALPLVAVVFLLWPARRDPQVETACELLLNEVINQVKPPELKLIGQQRIEPEPQSSALTTP